MKLFLDSLDSPIGSIHLVSDGEHLCAAHFGEVDEGLARPLRMRFGAFEFAPATDPIGATAAFRAYFTGDFTALECLSLEAGGTPFQRLVWSALRDVPAGAVSSYGAIAQRIGRPSAARAVGHANGQNPVCIVVPCHRIIGAAGDLTGYGGGLDRKRWLLAHEGAFVSGARVMGAATPGTGQISLL
jgi:methylated-DNA-[protein]-cysteine S-methyltransferase